MRTTALFIFSFVFICHAAAQERSTGFEMLNISPVPYSLSKGEATVSMPNGAASIYNNPALLSYNAQSSIDLGYSMWIADESNIFGGLNLKNGKQAIAFAFYTSGSGNYAQRDQPGPSNGSFSIRYLSLAAAYSYNFGYFSLGAAAQYLNEDIFTYRASGYAFNLGAATKIVDDRIRLGASVSNLGEMEELDIEATRLPANFKAGVSADIIELNAAKNSELPILITALADYTHPLNEPDETLTDYIPGSPFMSFGLAFTVSDVLEISGGYRTSDEARPYSFGASFSTDNIVFNYALVPFKTGRGTVHSVGIRYQF